MLRTVEPLTTTYDHIVKVLTDYNNPEHIQILDYRYRRYGLFREYYQCPFRITIKYFGDFKKLDQIVFSIKLYAVSIIIAPREYYYPLKEICLCKGPFPYAIA